MNILRFLREQAKNYDCSACGQNHARSDIKVLGKLESAWIVRVTCAKCQTSFKLLVVVDDKHAAVSEVKDDPPQLTPAASRRPPVTLDDVIDAHEYLRTYDGDVRTLFRRRERVAERDTSA